MSVNSRQDVVQVGKVGESMWFLIYYGIIFSASIWYLWDKEWLWDPRQYWLGVDALTVPEFPYVTQNNLSFSITYGHSFGLKGTRTSNEAAELVKR